MPWKQEHNGILFIIPFLYQIWPSWKWLDIKRYVMIQQHPPPLLVQPISPKINDSYYKYDTLAVLC